MIEAPDSQILKFNRLAMEWLRKEDKPRCKEYLIKAQKLLHTKPESQQLHHLWAITQNNLSCLYKRSGELELALKYLTAALDNEKYHKRDALNLAGIHLNLSAIYSQLNQHEESLKQARSAKRALSNIKEKNQHVWISLVISHQSIGVEQEYLGNLTRAGEEYLKGWEIAQEHLGKENLVTESIRKKYFSMKITPEVQIRSKTPGLCNETKVTIRSKSTAKCVRSGIQQDEICNRRKNLNNIRKEAEQGMHIGFVAYSQKKIEGMAVESDVVLRKAKISETKEFSNLDLEGQKDQISNRDVKWNKKSFQKSVQKGIFMQREPTINRFAPQISKDFYKKSNASKPQDPSLQLINTRSFTEKRIKMSPLPAISKDLTTFTKLESELTRVPTINKDVNHSVKTEISVAPVVTVVESSENPTTRPKSCDLCNVFIAENSSQTEKKFNASTQTLVSTFTRIAAIVIQRQWRKHKGKQKLEYWGYIQEINKAYKRAEKAMENVKTLKLKLEINRNLISAQKIAEKHLKKVILIQNAVRKWLCKY